MLSNKALTEYRAIRKEETGVVPPESILTEEAIKLLVLFDYVYRPIKKVWLEEFISKNKKHGTKSVPQQLVEEKQKS